MFFRILTILLMLILAATGQNTDAKRIAEGDPLSRVYRELGTPVLEYPLNGELVQQYAQCTIISSAGVVLSADYKEAAEVVDTPDPVEKDPPPTIDDIKALAMQGDAESQYLLAFCFQFGNIVEQDYVIAIAWYKKAAMQGHMPSQHNLGYMYMTGKGIEQDYEQAYIWALLAEENGNDTLKKALIHRLSQEQILTGELKAEQMKLLIKTPHEDAKHEGG